jgi:hypothetical protein
MAIDKDSIQFRQTVAGTCVRTECYLGHAAALAVIQEHSTNMADSLTEVLLGEC